MKTNKRAHREFILNQFCYEYHKIVLCVTLLIFKTEPVSSVKPKFSSTDIKIVGSTRSTNQVSLICPAQGSPVPLSRFVHA